MSISPIGPAALRNTPSDIASLLTKGSVPGPLGLSGGDDEVSGGRRPAEGWPRRPLSSVAVPSQAIEATGLGADQDLGAVIAVEVGQHGLAHPAAQRDR